MYVLSIGAPICAFIMTKSPVKVGCDHDNTMPLPYPVDLQHESWLIREESEELANIEKG